MKFFFLFIIYILIGQSSFAQPVQKLILNSSDSTLINDFHPKFDSKQNFLFTPKTDSGYVMISNYDTTGPIYNQSFADMESYQLGNSEKKTLFISGILPYRYNSIGGENWSFFRYPKSQNGTHEAIAIQCNDKVSIFIDGRLIKQIDTLSNERIFTTSGKSIRQLENKKQIYNSTTWAGLSNNGNCIYSLEENMKHFLYLNHKLIDSSDVSFYRPIINNNGKFIYYKTEIFRDSSKVKFLKYVHNGDTIIGPIYSHMSDYGIMENGGYFYLDFYNQNSFILVNNQQHHDTIRGKIEKIIIPDEEHYLCVKSRQDDNLIYFNSQTVLIPNSKILIAASDTAGNSALIYAQNLDFFYWNNGKTVRIEPEKSDAKIIPVSTDTYGNFIILYETLDSSYLYRNDELLFSSSNKDLKLKELNKFMAYFPDKTIYSDGDQIIYLEVNGNAYLIEGTRVKHHIPKLKRPNGLSTRKTLIGEVITGEILEDHYYFIRKDNEYEYSLYVDGKFIWRLENIQRMFNSSSLINNEIVLYGIKEFSLYSFSTFLEE